MKRRSKGSAVPSRTRLPWPTDRLKLGETGLMVSPFCLGRTVSEDAVDAAFDHGINFFFVTADMHWPLYEPARRSLERLFQRKGVRKQVVVAVVLYVTQPEFCHIPFREVLDSIRDLKWIDVAVIGGAYSYEFRRRLDVFRKMKETGECGIRSIGISFHDRRAAVAATNQHLADICFIRYNCKHTGAASDIFPKLQKPSQTLLFNFTNTIGFVKPSRFMKLGLTRDYWRPAITDHYRFVLSRQEIDGLLFAAGNASQVEALIRALQEGPLTEEEQKYLIDLSMLDQGRVALVE